jgi:hypothetical protein
MVKRYCIDTFLFIETERLASANYLNFLSALKIVRVPKNGSEEQDTTHLCKYGLQQILYQYHRVRQKAALRNFKKGEDMFFHIVTVLRTFRRKACCGGEQKLLWIPIYNYSYRKFIYVSILKPRR